jgi:tRNA threonylcarbamoyladenosine biosynthesis protein TsaE
MDNKAILNLRNENETQALAKKLAKFLKPGSIIHFNGDLGSGKTTLISSIVFNLGHEHGGFSPTYSYMNQYNASIPIFHYDLYRIENSGQWQELGLQDSIFNRSDIHLVEWAERGKDFLPTPDLKVNLTSTSPSERRIEICNFSDNMLECKNFFLKKSNKNASID